MDEAARKELQEEDLPKRCSARCEVWSRIVGYYRPLSDWNRGKRHEFSLRRMVRVDDRTVERIPESHKSSDCAE